MNQKRNRIVKHMQYYMVSAFFFSFLLIIKFHPIRENYLRSCYVSYNHPHSTKLKLAENHCTSLRESAKSENCSKCENITECKACPKTRCEECPDCKCAECPICPKIPKEIYLGRKIGSDVGTSVGLNVVNRSEKRGKNIKNKDLLILRKNEMKPKSKPFCVIFLHSCSKTFSRLEKIKTSWAYHKYMNEGIFEIQAVLSKPVKKWSPFKQMIVGCNDERIFAACRFQRSYDIFLTKYPNTPWLFTADDDTWIDLDNLYAYTVSLSSIQNPMEDLIVKGHANYQGEDVKRYYLHGGCGWLCSRGFLTFCQANNINLNDFLPYAKYRQPDTAQSIVLRHVFENISDWDEFFFQGFDCQQCEGQSFDKDSIESISVCVEDTKYGRLKDIISYHTIGMKESNFKLGCFIKTAPDNILFYKDPKQQKMGYCRIGRKWDPTISDYSTESLGKKNKIYKADDIKTPIVDFLTLLDEQDPVKQY